MTNGIFLKLMAAFAVVILATAITFDAMLGGAVRLAYPLSDVEAVSLQIRHRLELASALAFLFALVVGAPLADLAGESWVSPRPLCSSSASSVLIFARLTLPSATTPLHRARFQPHQLPKLHVIMQTI